MNEDQQKLYNSVRSLFHNEYLDCTNLAGIIKAMFPENEEDHTSVVLRSLIPILQARAVLGTRVMDIFYELERKDE